MVVLIRKEEALELVQNAQVALHWGLLPLVLYLGECPTRNVADFRVANFVFAAYKSSTPPPSLLEFVTRR